MPKDFHQRFEIKVDKKEAERRFVNRIFNKLFDPIIGTIRQDRFRQTSREITSQIADALGDRYELGSRVSAYILDDFYRCLQAVEAMYQYFGYSTVLKGKEYKTIIDIGVNETLLEAEVDLSIEWTNGRFKKKGAKLLDEKLVNESLRWLSDKKYESVLNPFSKGLEHFLHAENRPELLSDVITDTYEALEAIAKIVTGRETKDLSGNAELFIKKLGVSDSYKRILKGYISYANEFRHALQESKEKPNLSIPEVESFIYMTGLFIRLATKKVN